MSDENPLGGELEIEPGDGELGGEVEVQETPAEQERRYVEVDDPDNRFVRVKVDGEDVEVPFSEAVRGYSREAHFTRQMQEVAQQRQEAADAIRLRQALNDNPREAVRLLATAYGVELGQPAQPAQPEVPQFDDPLEQQLWETRQELATLRQTFEERDFQTIAQRAAQDLKATYQASDEDVEAVFTQAAQQGLGVEALPMLMESRQYRRIQAAVRAQQTTAQETAAETQRRQQAAAAAGNVIATGTGSAAPKTATLDPGTQHFDSPRSAVELALDALGIT